MKNRTCRNSREKNVVAVVEVSRYFVMDYPIETIPFPLNSVLTIPFPPILIALKCISCNSFVMEPVETSSMNRHAMTTAKMPFDDNSGG